MATTLSALSTAQMVALTAASVSYIASARMSLFTTAQFAALTSGQLSATRGRAAGRCGTRQPCGTGGADGADGGTPVPITHRSQLDEDLSKFEAFI